MFAPSPNYPHAQPSWNRNHSANPGHGVHYSTSFSQAPPSWQPTLSDEKARQQCFGKALLYLSAMVFFTWMVTLFAMTNQDFRYSMLHSQDHATGVIVFAGLLSMGLLWLLEWQVSVLAQAEQQEEGTTTARLTKKEKDDAIINAVALLFLFTLGQSVVVSVPCAMMAHYGLAPLVVSSFGMTCFLFAGLTIFAMQTKYDFTPHKGMVLMGVQGFLLWSFFGFDVGAAIVTACLVLFMIYVIISVQQVLHKSRPGTSTALLAAVKLYSGFLNIFLRILHLMLLSKLEEKKREHQRRRR